MTKGKKAKAAKADERKKSKKAEEEEEKKGKKDKKSKDMKVSRTTQEHNRSHFDANFFNRRRRRVPQVVRNIRHLELPLLLRQKTRIRRKRRKTKSPTPILPHQTKSRRLNITLLLISALRILLYLHRLTNKQELKRERGRLLGDAVEFVS